MIVTSVYASIATFGRRSSQLALCVVVAMVASLGLPQATSINRSAQSDHIDVLAFLIPAVDARSRGGARTGRVSRSSQNRNYSPPRGRSGGGNYNTARSSGSQGASHGAFDRSYSRPADTRANSNWQTDRATSTAETRPARRVLITARMPASRVRTTARMPASRGSPSAPTAKATGQMYAKHAKVSEQTTRWSV